MQPQGHPGEVSKGKDSLHDPILNILLSCSIRTSERQKLVKEYLDILTISEKRKILKIKIKEKDSQQSQLDASQLDASQNVLNSDRKQDVSDETKQSKHSKHSKRSKHKHSKHSKHTKHSKQDQDETKLVKQQETRLATKRQREDESEHFKQCSHPKLERFLILGGWIRHKPRYLDTNPKDYCLEFFCGMCRRCVYFSITNLEERSRFCPLTFTCKEIFDTSNLFVLCCSRYSVESKTIDYAGDLLHKGRGHKEAYYNQDHEYGRAAEEKRKSQTKRQKEEETRLEHVKQATQTDIASFPDRTEKSKEIVNLVDDDGVVHPDSSQQPDDSNNHELEDYFDLNDQDLSMFY